MYVDYKDVELLKKLTNRQGKIISRRKSGCTAMSQHAVTRAIKRARGSWPCCRTRASNYSTVPPKSATGGFTEKTPETDRNSGERSVW